MYTLLGAAAEWRMDGEGLTPPDNVHASIDDAHQSASTEQWKAMSLTNWGKIQNYYYSASTSYSHIVVLCSCLKSVIVEHGLNQRGLL